MKIFKFGGSSIHNASHIQNFGKIIKKFEDEEVLIVASAIDKTTNNLELLHKYYVENKEELLEKQFERIKKFHYKIIENLFDLDDFYSACRQKIDSVFFELEQKIISPFTGDEGKEYDSIVSYGELFSTLILSNYLQSIGVDNIWLDAREVIKTDSNYRDASVIWDKTEKLIKNTVDYSKAKKYLTQGFIGSDESDNATTLGREGSDFSAAIFGYVLGAESVTVWKDVDGVYNKDPHKYNDAQKIDELSYHETIELSYYGAQVIHPKTIKPLQNKKIPLFVKSFYKPEEKGTLIFTENQNDLPPIFIEKEQQTLLTIYPLDFSFIVEKHLERLFALLSKYKIKTSLLQHSAISFSIVFNDNYKNFPLLVEDLKKDFNVLYNTGLTLVTIRHYTEELLEKITSGKEIFIEQKTRKTARFVLK
jgi:aspartate kinase